jgi:hypothetical protein
LIGKVKIRKVTIHQWYALWPTICYLTHDGCYQKVKFVDGVVSLGLHHIGKMRCDANLRHLCHGPQKPRGRKKVYDGKVRFDDLSRLELAAIEGDHRIYTAVVNSLSLIGNWPKVQKERSYLSSAGR